MRRHAADAHRAVEGRFTVEAECKAGALRTTNYFTWADVDQQCLGNSVATEQDRRSPLRASINRRGDRWRRPVGSQA